MLDLRVPQPANLVKDVSLDELVGVVAGLHSLCCVDAGLAFPSDSLPAVRRGSSMANKVSDVVGDALDRAHHLMDATVTLQDANETMVPSVLEARHPRRCQNDISLAATGMMVAAQ